MSDIGLNDFVLLANKRVLRNLAISMDHAVEQRVRFAVEVELELARAFCDQLETWLARGLEHPVELIANALLPVPRVLYATTNPAYSPAAGSDDLESLVQRLNEFDAVASGPLVGTLQPGADLCGIPLDLPCPIPFRRDTGRRWTFLRREFFQNDAPDFIEVTAGSVLITMAGTAFRGDFFSRHEALHDPTHDFTMRLRYGVEFVNQSDVAFGLVPFQMVADPPPASQPGRPRLPKKGQFIFATRSDVAGGHALLPSAIPFDGTVDGAGCDDMNGCQPPGLNGSMFRGGMDDLIYDSLEKKPFLPDPRYRVEARSPSEPECLVIRRIGDPAKTILAEARGGRLVLKFEGIETLELNPIGGAPGVSAADIGRIESSLIRLHPTLSQSFTCALEQPAGDGLDSAMVNVNLLRLLGPRALDLPLLPQSIVVPVAARVVRANDTDDIAAGFPANSVLSSVAECDVTESKFFPATQVFGVSGQIGGNGDQSFQDFSDGRDMAVGISQAFMQPMLDQLGAEAMAMVEKQSLPGLDPASLSFASGIGDGKLEVRVSGEGEIETPFFLPDIGYEFSVCLNVRLRAQKAVMNRDGKPMDRFGCPIPEEVLAALGLDLVQDRLELDAPESNPLCFPAYWDPDDGIACYDVVAGGVVTVPCPQPTRIPPPVLGSDLQAIEVEDPEAPKDYCVAPPDAPDPVPVPDDPACFGQESFTLPENMGRLKPHFALVVKPPGEDDVDLDVDVNFWAILLVQLLIVVTGPVVLGALAVLGPVGIPLVPVAIMAGLSAFLILPISGVIAGVIGTAVVRGELAKHFQELDVADVAPNPILAIVLEAPEGDRQPFALQGGPGKGAVIVRNHIVVQTADVPAGL